MKRPHFLCAYITLDNQDIKHVKKCMKTVNELRLKEGCSIDTEIGIGSNNMKIKFECRVRTEDIGRVNNIVERIESMVFSWEDCELRISIDSEGAKWDDPNK